MSTKSEKLELARKKLKQYKKSKGAVPSEQDSVNENHHLSSNSSLNGNLVANSPGRFNSPLPAEPDYFSDHLNIIYGSHHSNFNESQGYVMASLPPPNPTPNTKIMPAMQFDSAEEIMTLKQELTEAVSTISRLMSEKTQLESLVDATKAYYTEHFTKNAEAYTQQLTTYQQSMQNGFQEVEKKYNLEIEYRKKLEDQIGEFQESQEKLKKENKALESELEKRKEIIEEIQEKLLTKNNAVHNLEIKNEEMTNSLELANLSLKQHRVSLMNLEDSQSKDRKAKFELEKMQAQLENTKETARESQTQNNSLKADLKNQRALHDKEKSELKSEAFGLKEKIESLTSEKSSLAKQVEKLSEAIQSVEAKYMLKSDVAELSSKNQQLILEKEYLLSEIESGHKKIEKLSAALSRLTKQIDQLEEENKALKSQNSDKATLVERSESDRVTISRALSQNAELKQMLEDSENKRDEFSAQAKTLQNKVDTLESKAELYDSTLQELFLTKNELENIKQEFEESKSALEAISNVQKVSTETNTEGFEDGEKRAFSDIGVDPMESEISEELTAEVSVELRDVQTNTEEEYCSTTTAETGTETSEGSMNTVETLKDKCAELEQLKATCDARELDISHLTARIDEAEKRKETETREQQERVEALQKALTEKTAVIERLESKIEEEEKTMEESKAVSSSESKSLMDNYRKLQVKMQALGKECEVLRFQNHQLETTNAKLAGENDTIGDYIYMYHAQREAMKNRDRSKSECIEKMMHEKESLTEKVNSLQYLLTSILTMATTTTTQQHQQQTQLSSTEEGTGTEGENNDGNEVVQQPNVAEFLTAQENGTEISENTPNNAAILNKEIRNKMIEALETVKSVSIATSEQNENLSRHFSNCKCCEGQILMV